MCAHSGPGRVGLSYVVLLAIAALVLVRSDPAFAAGNRIALVIGNSNYQHVRQLPTPVNDADDIAAELARLDFEVILRKDTGIEDLRRAIRDFSEQSAKADIALMYFGGYSVTAGGESYLVPVDAALAAPTSLRTEAVPQHLATLAVARARSLGLIIFDSLRRNPFPTKLEPQKIDRELYQNAAADAPDGFRNVLVFFATEPTQTTEDGDGRNSPLAAALLKYLPEPDLEISFLFRNVRDEVRKLTAQKQTPYMYGQLSKDKVFLNPVSAAKQAALNAETDRSAVQACDKLAAASDEARKNPATAGVRLEDIKTTDAVSACTDAVKQSPETDRLHFQLGRALFAAREYPSALAAYKKAFELGNPQAAYVLASMYEDGTGIEKDVARARFYYEVAAEMNFAPAIVRLAIQQERGLGAAPDLGKAYGFYRRAADLGDPKAINRIGVLTEKGLGVEKDAKRARQNYEKSAAMGETDAMVNLARCFANGIGGRKDIGEARRLLEKAALAGNADAKQILASVTGAPKDKRK